MSISEKIKEELKKQGLKPADLVRLSGVPQGRLSQILSGKTKYPRIDTISKLEAALSLPSGSLQDGEGLGHTQATDPDINLLIKEALVKYDGKEVTLTQDEFILLCTFRDMPDDEKKDFLSVAHDLWAQAKGL